ncbi:MAG TPA: Crp/Fnr family transcriptional regulator [Miltoncostaeaceae bacterium]|jgi:CRP/FNR family transcriptional regulator, cyclic AMP receptor protein|nr:Crp/Fnr family transcriptional regulator [Miltoncostaeaceae bacterium]
MAIALKEITGIHSARRTARPARTGLARMDLFTGLPDADLALLENRLPVVRWPRGAEIPDPLTRSDHVFLVREGRVAIFERAAQGHEVMTSILEEGSIWSTLGTTAATLAAALEDAAVSPLSGRAVEGLIARYPRLGRNLAANLSERVSALRETVALVSEMRVEDRLRARLHQLADRFGVAGPSGVQLRLELTHAQWASLVGASREAVTTAFSKLRGQGAIVVDGRSITIPWPVIHAHQQTIEERLAADAA